MTPREKELDRRKQYADWLAALKVGDRVCYRQNADWLADLKVGDRVCYRQNADWLADLKVGDRVCYRQNGGWSGASYEILVIERLTATQAVCSNGDRFRLKDGHVVGVDYRSIEPVTDEVLNAKHAAKLKQWFSTLKSQRQGPSIPVLQAMKDAFDAATTAEKGGAA